MNWCGKDTIYGWEESSDCTAAAVHGKHSIIWVYLNQPDRERRNEKMKKYKIMIIGGIRTAVKIKKDHERAAVPRTATFESKKNYNRQRMKRQTGEERDMREW
jgi:hypothetical protein